METTQRNLMFKDKIETLKGSIGENLVKEHFEHKGFNIFTAPHDRTHGVDFIAEKNKKLKYAVEVKTKPARKIYPDTGFDLKHYNYYKTYGVPVFIAFVDEEKKEIYGNFLNELSKNRTVGGVEYPLKQNGIIYFPLQAMKTLRTIDDTTAQKLKTLSTSNYRND